jgi:hypothetical protein
MATVNTTFPSLVDVAKRLGPDGYVMDVLELLTQINPILYDMAFREGNLTTGHTFGVRTALPTPTWRRYNQGVDPHKSQSETYTETCGMLEDYSKIDVALAALNGNGPAYRMSENKAFMQGFNNEVVRAILYESIALNPERIHGIMPRLNATANNPAAGQIIKADSLYNVGSTVATAGSDHASILGIGWGEHTVYGIFPKGSKGGLQHEDLGKQLTRDVNNKEFTAWVDHWKWDLGVAVEDYRYITRVCNIDATLWKPDMSTGQDLTLCFDAALDGIREINTVNPVLYCRKEVFTAWRQQMIKKGTANLLEWVQRGNRKDWSYMGVPIVRTDAMSLTEAQVS